MTDPERKLFPVLGSHGAKVDWQFVADHGKQAHANHYQTVEHLAKRGGLSWSELAAVVGNRKWSAMQENDAMLSVRKDEARYLAAIQAPSAADTIAALRARVEKLEEVLEGMIAAIDRAFPREPYEQEPEFVALVRTARADAKTKEAQP